MSDEGRAVAETVRYEEELRPETRTVEAGRLRVRKHVDEETVSEIVGRSVEHAEVERVGPVEADSGQIETLPDGSLSIPVFEEQLVVTKRLVVTERIIVRKHHVTEDHEIEATVRRERVEVEADDDVVERVRTQS